MLKVATVLGAGALVLWAGAAAAKLDFSDYDTDLMRDLDRTIKYFEPDINAKNASRAAQDAEVLLEGLRYTEDYFTKKPGAEDGVRIAREGLAHLNKAMDAIQAKDFDGAAASAREVAKNCKTCHDIYKTSK